MKAGEPVRVAVLGTGAIAQVVHLPILARLRGAEVTTVYDQASEKARTVGQRFEIPRVARSDQEVWEDPEVDAVVICTPSHLHEEHTRAALRAGKVVLCEKPLCLNAAGVERLLAEPGAEGRLMVAMNQRFRPDAAALKAFVSGGELGKVFYLKAAWLNRTSQRSRRSWRQRKESGGGAFMDLGVQMLDLALWLLDPPEPLRVSAQMHREPDGEVEDSASVMVRLADEQLINLEVTWSLRGDRDRQSLHLLGDAGSGSLSPFSVYKDMESGTIDVTPAITAGKENQYTASYRQELQHFLEVAQGEREVTAPREQVTLMRIVEAAYRSAEQGREVEV
jgi:predicted dehydrogenase